ncbi:hypothetical protein U1Q18_030271 [Sarracenia purpurea var. burkii]
MRQSRSNMQFRRKETKTVSPVSIVDGKEENSPIEQVTLTVPVIDDPTLLAPDKKWIEELGLLTNLSLFHINLNRFYGKVPRKFKNLKPLFALDFSNNRFAKIFPSIVLRLSTLKYLDLKFNKL